MLAKFDFRKTKCLLADVLFSRSLGLCLKANNNELLWTTLQAGAYDQMTVSH
jgi:hypothetical protein